MIDSLLQVYREIEEEDEAEENLTEDNSSDISADVLEPSAYIPNFSAVDLASRSDATSECQIVFVAFVLIVDHFWTCEIQGVCGQSLGLCNNGSTDAVSQAQYKSNCSFGYAMLCAFSILHSEVIGTALYYRFTLPGKRSA